MKVEQGKASDFLAMMAAEEFDQAVGSCDIGTNRVWRTTAAMGEMTRPTSRQGPSRMYLSF